MVQPGLRAINVGAVGDPALLDVVNQEVVGVYDAVGSCLKDLRFVAHGFQHVEGQR